MAELKVRVQHALGRDEALFRSKRFLGRLQRKFADEISDVKEDWSGDQLVFSFKAKGYAIGGVGTVGQDFVELSGELPWTAAMFRGKIESKVEQELKDLLREG